MGRLQSERHLDRYTCGLFYGKLSFLCDIVLKRDAFHKLHYDIIETAVLTYVKYVYYVRVRQHRCRLRFFLEFRNKGLILAEFSLHYLYRNQTIQLMIVGFINICHSAGADSRQNFISFP